MKPYGAITNWYNGSYTLINRCGHATSKSVVVVGTSERSPGRRVVVRFDDGSEMDFRSFKELRDGNRLIKED
jgi:hypothetical protein